MPIEATLRKRAHAATTGSQRHSLGGVAVTQSIGCHQPHQVDVGACAQTRSRSEGYAKHEGRLVHYVAAREVVAYQLRTGIEVGGVAKGYGTCAPARSRIAQSRGRTYP